jgi:hypothetical protein
MNGELERIWKEVVVAWSLFRHLSRRTGEEYEKPQNTWCPDLYSNQAPPEYEYNSAVLDSLAWCVVYVSILLKDIRNYKLGNILLPCNE